MTKGKPRGRTPSLIGGSNGRPKRASVKKKSECARCHSTLEVETDCFEIPKVGGAFANSKRFCQECFKNILEKTSEDLEKLRAL